MIKFVASILFYFGVLIALGACGGSSDTPETSPTPTPTPVAQTDIDLNNIQATDGLIRLLGSAGDGSFGVPVAAGYDVNGDGNTDYAMASMVASPQGRSNTGQIALVLGNGTINSTIDSASSGSNILTFIGDGIRETSGSEIWMGDVTGDGLGDLLIARQNFAASSPTRPGAGALSIVIGNSQLTNLAANLDTFDLRNPPAGINMITFIGPASLDRLGIWMRVGDITGDGIEDFAVGADQTNIQGTNSGTVFVVQGGAHLNQNITVDLNNIAASGLSPYIATVNPPANAANYHFGATLNIADLDNNGRAELIVGATVNRAGASITANGAPSGSAQGRGGFPKGRLFIIWDDNFPANWTDLSITADGNASGSITDIRGGTNNIFDTDSFGEEIIGGLDYDGDNMADLFIGDITGDTSDHNNAGLGFVFFQAANLKDTSFTIDNPPSGLRLTTILGPEPGAISSDTAAHGDFDNDGIDDLAIASPHANPAGRASAGAMHILWGQSTWPSTINLQDGLQPAKDTFNITNILGANGTRGSDIGDTLGYSASAADIDNDGRVDLIINEMLGNGSNINDVGNLLVISGALLAQRK
ncbi:hypothetical protein [Agarilytica rhodophyticola]|uniref:hypothetical protein n=1 Tax=Agarilytica rhodophyticola TaxID=1737490 RepID=UPI000B3470BD|nr:hypothetical protein [Agarilytica rhodophyticola]